MYVEFKYTVFCSEITAGVEEYRGMVLGPSRGIGSKSRNLLVELAHTSHWHPIPSAMQHQYILSGMVSVVQNMEAPKRRSKRCSYSACGLHNAPLTVVKDSYQLSKCDAEGKSIGFQVFRSKPVTAHAQVLQ